MQRILVYRPGQLGDTVVGLPAIRAIQNRHPGAQISLLTDAHPGKGLVSSWEILGRAEIFSQAFIYSPKPPLFSLFALALRLRRLKARRLYYLAPSPRTRRQAARDRFFFHVLCGIPESRGLEATNHRAGSEAARLLAIADKGATALRFDLPIGEAERAKVDVLWRASGLAARDRVIALAPGAKTAASRWPLERYQELARGLLSSFGDARLAIIGSGSDRPLAQAIRQSAGPRALDWTGRLTVLEAAETLRRCALFVGNNSGAMQLAAAVATRCVAISSARDYPGVWEPQGQGHAVLYKQVPCAGCRLSVCEQKALLCLTSIAVDEVFKACSSILEAPAPCPARN